MEKQDITIGQDTYTLVPRQKAEPDSSLRVYRGPAGYLRTGQREIVERTIASQEELMAAGFPVPRISAKGEVLDQPYFIEESLGDKSYSVLFAEDVERSGAISTERFDEFMRVVRRFVSAQLSTMRQERDEARFRDGVHIEKLKNELLQYADKIERSFALALEAMEPYPFVLSHGDLNTANMFPNGIIDIEDSLVAPLGFDLTSAVATADWFPDEDRYESYARFKFTPAQHYDYYAQLDSLFVDNGFPPLSAASGAFEFCRAVWLTARLHRWPKIQRWRYDKFVKKYLTV